MESCPERAIRATDSAVEFDPGRCTLCLRCYHRCPTEAIQVGTATLSRGRYAGLEGVRHFVPVEGYTQGVATCTSRVESE